MARIYKSPENEIAIKLMQNDVGKDTNSDALKVAGGDNDPVVLAGGLSPSGAENIHNDTNSDYSQILQGTSPEEHESPAKKQGMMGKMKYKAKKMKDTVKREFGKSDPSGANQEPLSSPPQEAETGGKPVPDTVPEYMTRIVPGNQV